MTTVEAAVPRGPMLARALRLEYLTVGWNVVEGVIAVAAAIAAGSVALMGFGIDSFVECASGSILIWRLLAERRHASASAIEQVERRAQRLIAVSLFALAAYIICDASYSLVTGERPAPSTVGMILTAVSLGVMWWLCKGEAQRCPRAWKPIPGVGRVPDDRVLVAFPGRTCRDRSQRGALVVVGRSRRCRSDLVVDHPRGPRSLAGRGLLRCTRTSAGERRMTGHSHGISAAGSDPSGCSAVAAWAI